MFGLDAYLVQPEENNKKSQNLKIKRNKVTIQPYKLWLLTTKVHFVAVYETFIASVL